MVFSISLRILQNINIDQTGGLKMEIPLCRHCNRPMNQFDDCGNEGWNCPNECHIFPPSAEGSSKELVDLEELEGMTEPDRVTLTRCWQCGYDPINRNTDKTDPPYGNNCPNCGRSLRYHPIYGVGGRKDLCKPQIT
jgi:hypothetical protein